MTAAVETTGELVQPDPRREFLPGESVAQFEARIDAQDAAHNFERGWLAAIEAVMDAAPYEKSKTRWKAMLAILDVLRDTRARERAVDAFRADQYQWRRKWADRRDAAEGRRSA